MFNKFKFINLLLLLTFFLSCSDGCSKKDPNVVKIGVISGPESDLMETAKIVAQKKYNLNVVIVHFNDYSTPNLALSDGSIDANMFQHQPFLEEEIKNRNFKLKSIGKTFIFPMGAYSKKIKTIKDLKSGSKIALPNDATNEARALLLLEKHNLIELDRKKGINITINDISKNPNLFEFIELDAAFLTTALADVDLAVINSNYAVPAGLKPETDAILLEGKDSPYANIIVVKSKTELGGNIAKLLKSIQSEEVEKEAKKIFKNQAMKAW